MRGYQVPYAGTQPDAGAVLAYAFADDRVRRYEALACLLSAPGSSLEPVVRAVIEPCEDCAFIDSPHLREIRRAGEDALAWCRNVGDPCSLSAEYARLFGLPGVAHRERGILPVCEGAYVAGDPDELAGELRQQYEALGFWSAADSRTVECPGHVGQELAFVAHCLMLSRLGLREMSRTADSFIIEHLLPWALVLGAAVANQAANPVLRYAGCTLEQLMACERHRLRSLSVAS